jgi:hypothetical protein
MAKAVISKNIFASVKSAISKSFPISEILYKKQDLWIADLSPKTLSAKEYGYGILEIADQYRKVSIDSPLQFRIRITNIGVIQYGPNNPAPIGVAVVGFNNYII